MLRVFRNALLGMSVATLAGVGIDMTTNVHAASPEQLAIGRDLFLKDFEATPATYDGDGLGPVFNESSCVACHNQGGVGGSGGVAKNARSLGLRRAAIRSAHLSPLSTARRANVLTQAVKSFSPGFVDSQGNFNASFALHRRGGSPGHSQLRDQSLSRFNPHWNDDQSASADTVHAERTPQSVTSPDRRLKLTVQVFARNTTALFGAGLIDQIPNAAILDAAKRQRRDRHVSGRPATLDDTRIGKFGWRGNFASLLEFNESACAAELGLQSKRVPQPKDIVDSGYRNLRPDLSDDQIEAMNDFVASLPRPVRIMPQDSLHREEVLMGEKLFANVGCAACHQPQMGNVTGLYSDLLLHEMGSDSVDMASAPPYRTEYAVAERLIESTSASTLSGMSTYYGVSSPMSSSSVSGRRFDQPEPSSALSSESRYEFAMFPSQVPPETSVLARGKRKRHVEEKTEDVSDSNFVGQRVTRQTTVTEELLVSKNEPTLVNQEWRTPPLWGVADSAPYLHDGRAETLLEAISLHAGEAEWSRNRFLALSLADQNAIISFLETLVAPPKGVLPTPPRHQLVSRPQSKP